MSKKEEQEKFKNLVPILTDEQLAKNAEFQAELRLRFAAPNASPDNNQYARMVVNDNLAILAVLDGQSKNSTAIGAANIALKAEEIKRETAMWMLQLGEIEKALELTPDEARKQLYQSYLDADNSDDDRWCEHPQWKNTGGNLLPNYFIEFDYHSATKGRQLSMVKCAECGFRNAIDIPSDLSKLRQLRAKTRGENAPDLVMKDGSVNLVETLKKI